jgi:hypothetical protein
MGGSGSWCTSRRRGSGRVDLWRVALRRAPASPPRASPSGGHAGVQRTVRGAAGGPLCGRRAATVGVVPVAFTPRTRRTCRTQRTVDSPSGRSRGWRGSSRWMRGEDAPPRGQLTMGAGRRAVIVRTRSRWLTAVISHPGQDIADVGHMKAPLRTQGDQIYRVCQYTPRTPHLPAHESCGRASFWGALYFTTPTSIEHSPNGPMMGRSSRRSWPVWGISRMRRNSTSACCMTTGLTRWPKKGRWHRVLWLQTSEGREDHCHHRQPWLYPVSPPRGSRQ